MQANDATRVPSPAGDDPRVGWPHVGEESIVDDPAERPRRYRRGVMNDRGPLSGATAGERWVVESVSIFALLTFVLVAFV